MHVNTVPEGKERERVRPKKVFEEISENFLNLVKDKLTDLRSWINPKQDKLKEIYAKIHLN